jgi:ABC-type polysaccharide/polyol phosphate export permease
MSANDDRIARWRARREAEKASREAHPDLPTDLAVIASRAEALGQGDVESAEPILELLVESLRLMPREKVGERRRIYDAIARGIEKGVEQSGDPQSDYAELRRRQLRALIRVVENDLRLGIDPVGPGYRPSDIDEPLARLADNYSRRKAKLQSAAGRSSMDGEEAYQLTVSAEDEGDLLYLRDRLAIIDGARRFAAHDALLPGFSAWRALLRFQFAFLRSESRFALLWSFIGPAMLIAILSGGYYFLGARNILNMDVPTFAMIGGTTWYMLRNAMFRTSTSFHNKRALLNFRPLTPVMTGLSAGLIYMASYVFVFPVLIIGGYLLDFFTLPHNVIGVIFWVAVTGVTGLAIGANFGVISTIWPFFRNLGAVIQRSMMAVSGTFLVSEQLPVAQRDFILWSPLTHAVQLVRQAYFEGYVSDDASPEYLFTCIGVLSVTAAIGQRLVRHRTFPA